MSNIEELNKVPENLEPGTENLEPLIEAYIDELKSKLEKASDEEKKELLRPRVEKCTNLLKIPFCCTTSVPKGFDVETGWCKGKVTAKSCLHCKYEIGTIKAICNCSEQTCVDINACLSKVVGCIQFIASTKVRGECGYSYVCCSSSICVDECVDCKPICEEESCPCPPENGLIPIKYCKVCLITQPKWWCACESGCPNDVTFYGLIVVDVSNCVFPYTE